MKANGNNCHLITSKQSCMNLKVGDISIENSTCEKLLGVKVDNKHTLNEHVDEITKKASRKVSALSRIFGFMNLTKIRFLVNPFFTLPFSYCPHIWIISKLHKRYLRIVYNEKKSSFKELLETDKSVLSTELFKVYRNIPLSIVKQLFWLRNNDSNLDVRSVFFGRQIISFLG